VARKKSPHLTDAELRLMRVLWDHGASTVSDVLEKLDQEPPLAYSTVITTLRILETKGYVRHKKDGRAFTYEPLVARQEARHSAVTQLLQRFFEGSPELLMTSLFQGRKLDVGELKRLRQLIAEAGPEEKKR
jgi:predicted transcriptional regulator